MEKIIFLADLHIRQPGETIVGLDPSDRLQLTLEAALEDHPDAKALILMGDLTHHGQVGEYEALKRILETVSLPMMPMLGNHDRREAFLEVFPQTGHVQQIRDIGKTRIITLDSLDGPPYADDHHAGLLCADRLAFMDKALATRDGRFAVVCMHHPPFDTGIIGMDRIKLRDGEAFIKRLATHGNLHLMCGHVHRTISGVTHGVPWTVLKSPCHQGVVDLTSPNAHLSTDEPGGYALGLLMPDGIVLHHQDVGTGASIYGSYDTSS